MDIYIPNWKQGLLWGEKSEGEYLALLIILSFYNEKLFIYYLCKET